MSDFQQFLNNRHFDHAPPGVPLLKKERKKKQAVQKIYLLMTTRSDTRQIHAA